MTDFSISGWDAPAKVNPLWPLASQSVRDVYNSTMCNLWNGDYSLDFAEVGGLDAAIRQALREIAAGKINVSDAALDACNESADIYLGNEGVKHQLRAAFRVMLKEIADGR